MSSHPLEAPRGGSLSMGILIKIFYHFHKIQEGYSFEDLWCWRSLQAVNANGARDSMLCMMDYVSFFSIFSSLAYF